MCNIDLRTLNEIIKRDCLHIRDKFKEVTKNSNLEHEHDIGMQFKVVKPEMLISSKCIFINILYYPPPVKCSKVRVIHH